jgi:hypothetical protein
MKPILQLLSWIWAPLFLAFGGGDSSSSSSSSNTTSTTNIDKRQVVDGGSVGVTSDNSTVNVLDNGAVKQSIDLAKSSSELAYANLSQLLGFAKQSLELTKSNASQVETAFKTAGDATDTQKLLILGGLAVAGFIAYRSA